MDRQIEVRALAFGTVLRDVSLEVAANEFIVITGANGCGKTTLVRLLLGLLKPTHGSIRYYRNGQQVKNLNVGYLPQQNRIDRQFPITVQTVIGEPIAVAERLMQQLGISHLAQRLIGELSGGELQRVMLARAMATEPELLVLDEPTTYIDTATHATFAEMIREQIGKRTMLIVTHHPDHNLYASAREIRL